MSETGAQDASILLPQAKIAVFSKDETTLQAAQSLIEDWRFARVEIDAQDGDVAKAIATYAEIESPDLVIVQTEEIDDGFAQSLETLAGNCVEGTSAVVVGPVNDVYLYRRLIDMGVSDYLVKPLSADILGDVIGKTLIEKLGVSDSRLITFIGAKGGLGTTVLAEAAAWASSEMLGQKTLLMDLAGGWSSMSVGLGFEPVTTLYEAVRAAADSNEDNLNRMLHDAGDKLSVLAHGGDVMLEQPVKPEQVEMLIDRLMVKYPAVIVDLSDSPASLKKTVLSRSNQIVVVSNTLLPSLRLARSLIHEIKELRGGDAHHLDLLINMAGMTGGQGVPRKDIEAAMDYKPSGFIDYDPKLFTRAESEGRKIIDDVSGRAVVERVLIPLLQSVLRGDGVPAQVVEKKPDGFIGSLVGKLTNK